MSKLEQKNSNQDQRINLDKNGSINSHIKIIGLNNDSKIINNNINQENLNRKGEEQQSINELENQRDQLDNGNQQIISKQNNQQNLDKEIQNLIDQNQQEVILKSSSSLQKSLKPMDVSLSVHTDPIKSKKILKNRALFTDWMRSISIYLVVAVHVGVSLQRSVTMSLEENEKIEAFLRQSLQFIMPLFFYYSGRSASFSRDSYLQWNWKKFLRLITPLVFGTLVIVIPTAYIGRQYRPQTNKQSDISFSYFYSRYFQDEFARNGFEWLWFLPVLFGLSFFNFPFFRIFKAGYLRENGGIQKSEIWYLLWHFLYVVCIMVAFFLINVKWGYMIILCAGVYIWYFLIAHYFGWIRETNRLELIFLPNVVGSLLLALFQGMLDVDHDIGKLLAMLFYHNMHYVEGFIDSLVYDEYREYKQQAHHLKWRPLSLLFILLLVCVCQPGTNRDEGYIWRYPIYQTPFIRILHVLGTWIWIAILLRWSQTYFNEELDKFQYKFFNESSIIVYISHWLWMELANKYLVYDFKIPLLPSIFILIISSFIGCCINYYIILKIPTLGFFFGIDPLTLRPKKANRLDDKSQQKNQNIKLNQNK